MGNISKYFIKSQIKHTKATNTETQNSEIFAMNDIVIVNGVEIFELLGEPFIYIETETGDEYLFNPWSVKAD